MPAPKGCLLVFAICIASIFFSVCRQASIASRALFIFFLPTTNPLLFFLINYHYYFHFPRYKLKNLSHYQALRILLVDKMFIKKDHIRIAN